MARNINPNENKGRRQDLSAENHNSASISPIPPKTTKNTAAESTSDDFAKVSSPWLRKPVWAAMSGSSICPTLEAPSASLPRHLSLCDLLSIGVGGTIGSGIFVLCGLIAHDYAGPATLISWGIAGISACTSGLCFAELSGRFPVAGSSYSYAYLSMGELPAVIAGSCLTLEYLFSASAVARSWGDKMVEYIGQLCVGSSETYDNVDVLNGSSSSNTCAWVFILRLIDPGYGINPMAFLVSVCSVILLLYGVKESQRVTNFFTTLKVGLVLFMSFGALSLLRVDNLHPFIPPKFGVSGILRGSTSSFFAYIGYDEICCMAGEAIDPSRNLPRAVIGTIGIVTILYMFATIALVGMVPYEDISVTSAFPDGFRSRGWHWAAQMSALGELITLPVVVLIAFMAQPRLQYAMAIDGLLPPAFAHVDNSGGLKYGIIISGILMVLTSTFVPFTYLNDLISAGILVAFCMTDASVVLLRYKSPPNNQRLLQRLLGWFNALSLILSLLWKHCPSAFLGKVALSFILPLLFVIAFKINYQCLLTNFHDHVDDGNHSYGEILPVVTTFQTPFVPYLPLFGTFLNWCLIGQLEVTGLLLLMAYFGAAIVFYFAYGATHSVGNNRGWGRQLQQHPLLSSHDYNNDDEKKIYVELTQTLQTPNPPSRVRHHGENCDSGNTGLNTN